MSKKKCVVGLIALDIDGTITAVRDMLDPRVADFLAYLHARDFVICFVTGRTFHFSEVLLRNLSFPYFLGVHNGAWICSMPDAHCLAEQYMSKQDVVLLEEIIQQFDAAGVVYTGPRLQNRSYVCRDIVTSNLYEHMEKRRRLVQEEWIPVCSWKEIQDTEFLAVRVLATAEIAWKIVEIISHTLAVEAHIMGDSCDAKYLIIQVTKKGIHKGCVISFLKKQLGISASVIAAGDDHNDYDLLLNADIKVVMETAPPHLLKLADVIAPSAQQLGIIQGLEQALLQV